MAGSEAEVVIGLPHLAGGDETWKRKLCKGVATKTACREGLGAEAVLRKLWNPIYARKLIRTSKGKHKLKATYTF